MYIRLHNTAQVFKRACKVSQGASTLFKVCKVLQEPFEVSLLAKFPHSPILHYACV